MDDQAVIERLRSDLRAQRDATATPDWLVDAGRRRWRRRRARRAGAGAVFAAIALVGGALIAGQGGDPGAVDAGPATAPAETTTSPAVTATSIATDATATTEGPLPTGPPTQTAEDAARDGIVPAVAELPFPLRVDVRAEAMTPEGTWVISEPSLRVLDLGPEGDCALGDTTGTYAVDWICPMEADEVLLIGDDGRILRAYPMSQVTPSWLLVTDEAVYGGRVGDGGQPHSSLFRIDRQTLDLTGVVFADPDGVPARPGTDAMLVTTASQWRDAPAGTQQADVLHEDPARPGTPVVSAINGDYRLDVEAAEALLAGG